ncbi:hypothetical protein BHE74_00013482, partial [Ensete ventricosum]
QRGRRTSERGKSRLWGGGAPETAVMIWMCSASRILLPQYYFVVLSEISIIRIQYIVKAKDLVDQSMEGMRSPALHLLFANADMKNPLLASGRSTTFLSLSLSLSLSTAWYNKAEVDNVLGDNRGSSFVLFLECEQSQQRKQSCIPLPAAAKLLSACKALSTSFSCLHDCFGGLRYRPTKAAPLDVRLQLDRRLNFSLHRAHDKNGKNDEAREIFLSIAMTLSLLISKEKEWSKSERPSLGCSQQQGINVNLCYYQLGITFLPFWLWFDSSSL